MGVTTAHHGEAEAIYPSLAPGYTLIVSDGAYGIGGFPGDPTNPRALPDWYAPHLAAWDRLAAPSSSLYFWGTPEGCARMLPHIEAAGWTYRSRIVWNKGPVQGMSSPDLRSWPPASEDCYFFVRESVDISALAAQGVTTGHDGLAHASLGAAAGADERNAVRKFLRSEWRGRAGLTNADANAACGVAYMASRHYFGPSQWWLPTWAHFQSLAAYAKERGPAVERPYFVTETIWALRGGLRESYEALRGEYEALRGEYEALRYPFALPQGVTDVWDGLPVSRPDRHGCAKRDDHIERIVLASSRPGDRVLEPFGGGAPVLRACRKHGRLCDSIERDPEWHARATASLETRPELTATKRQPSLFGAR